MKVEVVRSPRRRKTVQAREVNGVLRVSIPASMNQADEARWVAEMLRRMDRRSASQAVDLDRRVQLLAGRYQLRRPRSIRWSDNQEWRWGSCTPAEGTVRISSRLAREPLWVIDYVIVHELAHLSVPRHDDRFWALVNRYPLAERARGFLIARGMHKADDPGADDPAADDPAADDPGADVGAAEQGSARLDELAERRTARRTRPRRAVTDGGQASLFGGEEGAPRRASAARRRSARHTR